jgi:hypothetical protein
MSISKRCARALGCLAVLVAAAAPAAARESGARPPPQVETTLRQMLEAVKDASNSRVVAPGDPRFMAGLTTTMFEDLSRCLAPRLMKGYSTSYFGQLRQRGYEVYVWKLTFDDGGDDLLLTAFATGVRITGFLPR